ncbi:hypothetical protein [Erythrobacter sp. QSSC1-22B]|uniref:hypothetical protein n=1 Tax=Erythrobacter sp. QSSC1-22B TaxID=1860125 RepID=UPI001F3B0727|nr:hypothetical protein [Erythrobacter sp. QSSC1-22B]
MRKIDKCTEVFVGIVPVCSATSVDVMPFFARAMARYMSSLVGWAKALSFAIASIFSILQQIALALPTGKLIQCFNIY